MYEESPGRKIAVREVPVLVDHLTPKAAPEATQPAGGAPQLDSLGAKVVDEGMEATAETLKQRATLA